MIQKANESDRLIKVAVVIPAYNEQDSIKVTIESIQALKTQFRANALDLLVYVVNDGSTDNTAELARQGQCDRLISHRTNLGLGAAIRTGLLAARKDQIDIAVKYDADAQHDPVDILPLIAPILNDEADVVYGNRFDRIQYRMPFVRYIGNRLFTWVMRKLTGWPLKDSQPGILALCRDYLDVFHLPGDYNYTQQILLDAYHKGMRFAHVPVSFRQRTTGKSFISIKYPFKVIPQILLVLVSVKPFRIFGPLGLIFLLLGGAIFGLELVLWMAGYTEKPVLHVNFVLGFSLFGLQTLFFGLLAELIVTLNKKQ